MTIQKIEEDWRSYPMNDEDWKIFYEIEDYEDLEKICKKTFNKMHARYPHMVMGDLQSVATFIGMLLNEKKETVN
jgi:hypothetical protein